jgi:short-subunit dehydrogenase
LIDAAKYGPWAVVAGGSEGIGACIAAELAAAGINLVLIARKTGPLNDVALDLRTGTGVNIRTLVLDLTDPDMMDRVREITDDIDVGLLVYNAGASHRTGPFLAWPLEDVLKVIRLNVNGQALMAHHFGRRLAARGRGGLILVGSMAGNAGSPSVIAYAGAKAFSQIFAEGLWWELKQHGVDVLHVVVGPTATPAMARLGITYHEGEAVQSEEVARHTLDNIADGPVFVMPQLRAGFDALATVDRRGATLMNAAYVMGNTQGATMSSESQQAT